MARLCISTSMPALARRCGVREVVECRNGDLVQLSPQVRVIDEVPAGQIYKDGTLLVDADVRTIADRKRLSFAGAVSVAIAISEKGEMVDAPSLDLIGIPERDRDGDLMYEAVRDALIETFELLPRGRRRDPDFSCGSAAAQRARRCRTTLGQEADVPCACFDGMMRQPGQA